MKIDLATLMFDFETEGNLFSYCVENRLGIASREDSQMLSPASFKFHVTIMRSEVTSPDFKEGIIGFGPHICKPVGFDFFGPDCDLLVLKLEADKTLQELHAHYQKDYGHVYGYEFNPHITIKGAGLEAKNTLGKLSLPNFALRVDKLIHRIKVKD